MIAFNKNPGRHISGALAAGLLLALFVGGCSSLIAFAVPSHHQSLAQADIPAGRYVLDRSHASLHMDVGHMGYSRFIGRFDDFSATFRYHPKQPAASALSVEIDPASFNSGVEALDQTLMGAAWFDVGQYPQARLTAQSIDILSDTAGRITGRLELHGQTHPVTIDIVFNGGAYDILRGTYVLGFSATATLSRSRWGMTALGTLVDDEVRLTIHAEFVRQKDPLS